jgi:hypothetical protein
VTKKADRVRVLLASLLLFVAASAWAHPAGNERYSLLSGARVDETGAVELIGIMEVPMMVGLREVSERIGPEGRTEALVEAYTNDKCEQLGRELTVEIDGKPVKGTWAPMQDPRNGTLVEAFFMYLVAFTPEKPIRVRGRALDITMRTGALSSEDVVFSGQASADPPWLIASRSIPDSEWSEDAIHRVFSVRFERL